MTLRIPDVILEGPEGSGKTTTAKILAETFGHHMRHDLPPSPSLTDRNIILYYELLYESFPCPFVWDRSIIGELVYGPIFRKKSRITVAQVRDFLDQFRRRGGVAVLLLPPLDVCRDNWNRNRKAQLRKSPRAVKRAIADDESKLQDIWEAYYSISDLFDSRTSKYPDMGFLVDLFVERS